ncbi:hypothetical protein UY3_00881 [Chelonia mydas]|uniref:Uncharacterized protein n=1 Tax=Chelonia mydas TaxID=8469 RepID=M7BVK1_CHEMY|nr:hypothetical protein UY3_00881 [Chelonia mydas]
MWLTGRLGKQVAITKAKVDFSGVMCLPPSAIAGNGLDGGGAGENDDEPVLVSLSAAPSPQSEAVANELQELSLQPELTLNLHHGRNPNLPPLSERKNGSADRGSQWPRSRLMGAAGSGVGRGTYWPPPPAASHGLGRQELDTIFCCDHTSTVKSPVDILVGLEPEECGPSPEDELIDKEVEADDNVQPTAGSPGGSSSQELFSTPEMTRQLQSGKQEAGEQIPGK